MFSNPVEKCSAELERLRVSRARLEGRSIALETELAQLRSVTDDAILDELLTDGEHHPQSGTRLAAVEGQLLDIRKASAALIRRIQTAMIALGKARADELRAKGKKFQARLDRLSADRLKLLEQLRDLEGGGEGWVREYFTRRGFLPVGGGAAFGPVAAPAFDKLEIEKRQLYADADRIERQAELAAAGGRISGANCEELLSVCADVDQLAPTDRAIRAWFETASQAAESAWRQSPLGQVIDGEPPAFDPETLYTIVWAAGILDTSASLWQHRQTRRATSKDHEHVAWRNAYADAIAAVTRGVGVA